MVAKKPTSASEAVAKALKSTYLIAGAFAFAIAGEYAFHLYTYPQLQAADSLIIVLTFMLLTGWIALLLDWIINR